MKFSHLFSNKISKSKIKNSDRYSHNHIMHKYSYSHNLALGVGKSTYLILGIFAISFGLVSVPSAFAIDTCGLDIFDTSIIYNDLQLNDVSTEQAVVLSNPGTVNATLSINATNWIDTITSADVINVAETGFSFTSGTFASKTPLTLAFQDVGTLPAAVNTTTYWQLQANLLNTTFSGDLSQTINLRITCDGGTGGGSGNPVYYYSHSGTTHYSDLPDSVLKRAGIEFSIGHQIIGQSIDLCDALLDTDATIMTGGQFHCRVYDSSNVLKGTIGSLDASTVITNDVWYNFTGGSAVTIAEGDRVVIEDDSIVGGHARVHYTNADTILNARETFYTTTWQYANNGEFSMILGNSQGSSGGSGGSGSTFDTSNLIAYYEFDNNLEPTLIDESSAGGTSGTRLGIGTGVYEYVCQKVEPSSTYIGNTIQSATFAIGRIGSPTGDMYFRVIDSAETIKSQSQPINMADITTTQDSPYTFTLNDPVTLASGDAVCLYSNAATSATNNIEFDAQNVNDGTNSNSYYKAGTWTEDDTWTYSMTFSDVGLINQATTANGVINGLGSQANGIISGTTTGVTGIINESFSFDGTNDYLDLNKKIFDGQSSWSMNMWISPTSASNLVDQDSEDFSIIAGGALRIFLDACCNRDSITVLPLDGSWNMITVVYDGLTYEFFINGVQETSYSDFGAINSKIWDSGTTTRFGHTGTYGRGYMNGSLDDFSVWSRALNSTEVSNLYNNGVGLTITPGSATITVEDATDGTSSNTTWVGNDCHKTGGANGGWDADCVSAQTITAGQTGYVEFTYDPTGNACGASNTVLMAGLNEPDDEANTTGDYFWYPDTGEVFESGSSVGVKGTVGPTSTTVYKVEKLSDGTVNYYESGSLKYTSLTNAGNTANYFFDSSLLGLTPVTKICDIKVANIVP